MNLDYKKAGVDIQKANLFIDDLKTMAAKTVRKGVLSHIGGFGAFFDTSFLKMKNLVLVSSCDGVGTKLKIAFMTGIHDTVGVDLVAMSVNDVLCCGAQPLFFLDYIATGKIETSVLKDIAKGIIEGCRQSGCSLIGGETAEMPGMYKLGEYDLAGFCVGAVDKNKILGRERVKMGDAVIGLESSGFHSNGFSLVRKVFSSQELKGRWKDFLRPTRIYVKPVLALLKKFNKEGINIKAIAHITGGGFYDKAIRAVPSDKTMILYRNAWPRFELFEELQARGKIKDKEMLATFNMGIGMVLVVKDSMKMDVVRELSRLGVNSYIVGELVRGVGGVAVV